jgi:hypothetical protein
MLLTASHTRKALIRCPLHSHKQRTVREFEIRVVGINVVVSDERVRIWNE